MTAKTVYVDADYDEAASVRENTFTTIAEATRHIQPGDILMIEPGVYREAIRLIEREGESKKGLVIQGRGRDSVVIKGSNVVRGWKQHRDGVFVKREWATEPQQVFVNGEALQQIGGTVFGGYPIDKDNKLTARYGDRLWPGRRPGDVRSMPDKSFKYESSEKSLYFRYDAINKIDDAEVEVSVRPFSVIAKGWDSITLRNITFQHSNSSTLGRNGLISLWGDGHVLENLKVLEADSVGVHLVGNDISMSKSLISKAGRLGILARGRNHRYVDNITQYNNTRDFKTFWEAGGVKFVGNGGLTDSVITRHTSVFNNGDGLWFDWFNTNNEITDSILAYNQGFGLHYEASTGATVKGNVTFGNKHRGIYLPHSSNSRVVCNLSALNGMEGIVVIDEGRRSEQGDLRPSNNRIYGNIIAWNSKVKPVRPGLVLPDSNRNNSSNHNLFISENPAVKFSKGWPRMLSPVIRGLDDWQTKTGQDMDSWSLRMRIPDPILHAYKRRDVMIDWMPVLKAAAEHAFQGVGTADEIGCAVPGPGFPIDANPDNP